MSHFIRTLLAASLCTLSGVTTSSARFDLSSALDQLLDVYAPVSSVLAEGPCKAQGLLYKQAVKDGQSWALNMFDASSKPPSGVLAGNLMQLGSYDQCLEVRHDDAVLGAVVGQHCMVAVGVDNVFTWPSMASRYDVYSVYHGQHAQTDRLVAQKKTAEAFAKMGATLSVCVPAACTPADVQLHLRSALRGWLGDAVNITVRGNACNSKADPPPAFKTTTILAIISILSMISLVLMGTAYDVLKPEEPRNGVLVALSAAASYKRLRKTSDSVNALPVLDGVRVLSIFWVIFLHHYLFKLTSPTVNYHSVLRIETDWLHILISNGTFCVDSFLLLAGTLLSYNFLADRQKGIPFSLLKFYVRRYIRITPTLMAIMMIVSILLTSAGDGPFVKASISPMQNKCDNAWWMTLLYVTNYVPQYFECVNVNWYLSLDMQLVWISPLFLFPLWRWRRIGKTIVGSLLAAGIAIVFAITYTNEITINKWLDHVGIRSRQEELLYLPTHARFTPWVIGLALGRLLHTSSKSAPPALSKTHVAVGWFLSVALLLASLLSAHRFFQGGQPYDKMATALYVAFMRPAWASGLALLVFFCTTGYGGVVNKFLSWPGFLVPSRLSFAVYLCHWTVVSGYHAMVKYPRHFDDASTMIEFLGLTVFSFGVALFLHLFFEAPATALGKLLTGRFSGSEAKSDKQITDRDSESETQMNGKTLGHIYSSDKVR